MAVGITTTSVLPSAVQLYYDRALLSIPVPNLIHGIAAEKKSMKAHSGSTIRMARYSKLPTATVPLGNSGMLPPAVQLEKVHIDATIQFYGQYLTINEQVVLTSEDRILNETTKLLGISLRETEDELTRNMLSATASFINCTAGVNGRLIAVVKSFLMGLKLLTGNAEDNKAQASFGCAA